MGIVKSKLLYWLFKKVMQKVSPNLRTYLLRAARHADKLAEETPNKFDDIITDALLKIVGDK